MAEIKNIQYEYPYYVDYIRPHGVLTSDIACHACFHYGMLAGKARALAGTGIESQIIEYKVCGEIPEWYESRDEEIAKSVAILYQLESPDEFLRYKAEAWAQAKTLGVELDAEIFNVKPGKAKTIQ